MKEEEPTIVDEHHQLPDNDVEALPMPSYERINSPIPERQERQEREPFRISLLEMPIDPGFTVTKAKELK